MPAPLRLAVLLCVVLAACGDEGSQDIECADALRYGETRLAAAVHPLARDLPPRTGELRVTAICAKEKRVFETRRGIPPSVAVFPKFPYLAGNVRVRMYVADDTIEALAGHPLHRSIYGSAKRPDLTSGGHCRPVRFAAALINVRGPGELLVDLQGRETEIRVEARTELNGPMRDGVPRIPAHASLLVQAVRCNGPRQLVARRITVRSP